MNGDVINRILNRLLMYKRIKLLLKNRYLPRWVIFIVDIFIVLSAFFLSYNLRYSIYAPSLNIPDELRQLIPVFTVYSASFILFKPFAGIIRHTTSHDIQLILGTVLTSSICLSVLTLASRQFFHSVTLNVPLSIIVIHTMITATIMISGRIVIRYIYNFITRLNVVRMAVMIYGAGDLGQATLLAMERSVSPTYDIIGFIDSNRSMQGKQKSGKTIYSPDDAVKKLIPENRVQMIIMAIRADSISKEAEQRIISYCLENKIELRKVPPIREWLDGSFEAHQIRKIAIEDLLAREEIKLETAKIQAGLNGKTVMVTGAAGSIGSEIVRQLQGYKTGKIILLDQAESALYDLQMELKQKYNGSREFTLVIADISNRLRLESVFETYHPQVIFHAAAYKHVPLLEENVCEAISANIGGTKVMADLAIKYGVEKFVMISSDKAVNPTSVMGASKRLSELYVQSLIEGNDPFTKFITTRFGNVLGSNGSVVPLFTRQIEAGGPVTLTHREMKRYFMTIPEACLLVLEAGFMGNGGEIYLFDMGEPVKIYDLAVKMISLAGLVPGKDIMITETGLRPGEKLFEELLADKEHNLPTHHPKIRIANMRRTDPQQVKKAIDELLASAYSESEVQLVERIRQLIPEFLPQNPRFRAPDTRLR